MYNKRLIYQLFIYETGRTEVFFCVCVLSALFFYPSHFSAILSAFFIPVIFIRKKAGFLIGAVVLALYLTASYSLLVTGEKSYGRNKNVYSTTGGTLVTDQNLMPGDLVFGGTEKQVYSGENEGRFARGYNIAVKDGYVISVPALKNILKFRQEQSEGLFYNSGGELRLTQAVVIGDKNYLTDEIKDKFYLTGLGHMLAVSGLHVGLYGFVCFLLLGFLPFKARLLAVIVMLLVLIPFTGFKIPVLRAGLIGAAVSAAKLIDYQSDLKKLLLFCAGLFILVSPSVVADPSFLLSFSAVYGLLHMDRLKVHRYMMPFAVGAVASVFIIPAAAASFGSFNLSSVFSTPVLIPVLSFQVIAFLLYLIFPAVSLEPLILLEKIHLAAIDFFASGLGFMFTLFKTGVFWSVLMALFLVLCIRLRVFPLVFALLLVPYIPDRPDRGMYFPNMGASKGFVVIDGKTHIFYKGNHGDFMYSFIPYLAEIGISRADSGSINIYGSENRFINIASENEDYGGVCVNKVDENCKAVYHTRSDTYDCGDSMVHILYKNSCETENTVILSKTGDVKIEDKSK